MGSANKQSITIPVSYGEKIDQLARAYALYTGINNSRLDRIDAAYVAMQDGYKILSNCDSICDCPATSSEDPGEGRFSLSCLAMKDGKNFDLLAERLSLQTWNRKSSQWETRDRIYILCLKLGLEHLLSEENTVEKRMYPQTKKTPLPSSNAQSPFSFL